MTAAPVIPGWRSIGAVAPTTECIQVVTVFIVRYRYSIPRILTETSTLWSALESSPGLIGYALRADPMRKTLTTYSAWAGRESVDAFVTGQAHGAAASATRSLLQDSIIDVRTGTAGSLISTWRAVSDRAAESRANRPDEPPRQAKMGV